MFKSLLNLPGYLIQSLIKLISTFFKWVSGVVSYIIASILSGLRWFSGKIKQPAHTSALSIKGFINSVTAALIAGIFFYALSPDPVQAAQISAIAFGGMILCVFILPLALQSFYDEHEWTVGKQIIQHLLIVMVVGGGIIFFLNATDPASARWIGGLLLLSIIPLVIFSFILESQLSKKFRSGAASVMSNISANGVVSHDNPLKVLVFKDGTEKLSLVPNQLIYVKTGKTQSEFYYQNFFGVESTILSVDEKKVAEELNGHPQFDQFRRDHFVNVNGIKSIKGTARGYEIAIAKVNQTVKVSRKYRKRLESL